MEIKNEFKKFENSLQKWVIYAIYLIMIILFVNSCNSCNRNAESRRMRKEITALTKEIKTNDSLNILILHKVATKEDVMKYNDTLIGKFVYWQKQMDQGKYSNDLNKILKTLKDKEK